MVNGWASLSLRDEVVARLDAFIERNAWGYRNRAEVVTAAVRQFLEGDVLARAELNRALRAVALLEPATPAALLAALLHELESTPTGGADVGAKALPARSKHVKLRP